MANAAIERTLATRRATAARQADQLIDACIAAMRETQALDPPVAAILARAGLATKTFYRLFPSKTHLLVAVWERLVGDTVTIVEARCANATTANERLTSWIDGMVERMTSGAPGEPSLAPLAASFAARFPDDVDYPHPALLRPLQSTVEELLREHPVSSSVDAHSVALAIFDLVTGTANRSIVRATDLREEDRTALHTMVDRLLTSAPPPN